MRCRQVGDPEAVARSESGETQGAGTGDQGRRLNNMATSGEKTRVLILDDVDELDERQVWRARKREREP